ncbi:MAG: hypothetical protein R3358_08020 [Woeseiaceae bacterium]|nr:hypothetical protein [Woeseiaceae bacterium]
MARTQNPNLEIIEIAAHALGPLCDELVFLGGCATALLITDSAAPPVRVTRDVDALAEIGSTAEYHDLEKRLRDCGFEVDSSKGAPICRWTGHGILLDVMPTDEQILGFGNIWYASAVGSASSYELPSGTKIQLIDPVHYVATKIEAFGGRGHNDFVMSHDLEDVVCVLDGRAELENEIASAEQGIRGYVCNRLREFVDDRLFIESLPSHLPGDAGSQARLPMLIEKLHRLAALAS